jgi:hypothetical protein
MPDVTVTLTDEEIRGLAQLASVRGITANSVLQQAISTERLIADNVKPGDELLIKKPNNMVAKVKFG